MSRVQTLAFGILIVATAVTCLALGRWQLRRLADRRASNASIEASLSRPVVDLNTERPAGLAYRRVVAAGRYDHHHTVVLRGRPYRGAPGVEVVTPLLLEGTDTAVMVIRGFVPTADAVTVDRGALAQPPEASVRGVAAPVADRDGFAQPVITQGFTTWRRLEVNALASALPYPVLGVAIEIAPDTGQAGYPRPLGSAPLNDGPHLSYAIQWFAFATIAVVGSQSCCIGVGLLLLDRSTNNI